MTCPLCKSQASEAPPGTRTRDVRCTVCGHFKITFEASGHIGGDDKLAFFLAAWVYQQIGLGVTTPVLDIETVERMRTFPHPNLARRAEYYLGAVIRLLDGKLEGRFDRTKPMLRVASWSFDPADCIAIARYLADLGAMELPQLAGNEMCLLAKGHLIYEDMAGKRASSSQAFVAMWFDDAMKSAYETGIKRAIDQSGYEPLRIDRKEHEGKIDDRIIAEIRRSAFLVADFTDHRGGVYYEAGFAHGLGRRVIFTCRADHLNMLHFDIRQYNTIAWKNPEELVAPLQNRILALFGAGPLKPDAKPLEIG